MRFQLLATCFVGILAGPPPTYLASQMIAANGLPTCAKAKAAYQSSECCGAEGTKVYVPEYDGACENIVTMGSWRVTPAKFFAPVLNGVSAASIMEGFGGLLSTWWSGTARDRIGFKMLYETWDFNEGAQNLPFTVTDWVKQSHWDANNATYQDITLVEVAPSCSAMLVNVYNNNFEGSIDLYNQFMDGASFTTILPHKFKDNLSACSAVVRDPAGFGYDAQGNQVHNDVMVTRTLADLKDFLTTDPRTETSDFRHWKLTFATSLVQVCEKP